MTTSTPSTPECRVREWCRSGEGTERTCFDGDASIVHVAANVSEDLGLETKLADGLAVDARLFGGGGGSEFDVFYTKGVECLCDGDLCLCIEEGIGELLALWTMCEEEYCEDGRDEPLRVLSMILKFEMLFRKSEARGA